MEKQKEEFVPFFSIDPLFSYKLPTSNSDGEDGDMLWGKQNGEVKIWYKSEGKWYTVNMIEEKF